MRLLASIPFGTYAPDQPDLGNPGLESARNCLPRAKGYDSIPTINPYGTPGLPSQCVGAFSAKDDLDQSYIFAGTATDLYSLSGNSWTNASQTPGGYASAIRWDFTSFGDLVIAAHLDDKPQSLQLGSPTFADLTASAVQGAAVATVRSFVVLGNIKDTDGHNPARVRWSPLGDPQGDWTPSPSTLSDFQDLPSLGGKVQRVIGGEFGLIFRERSTYRMTFVGAPAVWQFDEIDPGIGTIAPGSVVQHGAMTFFLSEDGLRMTVGDSSSPIGEEKVDRELFSILDEAQLNRVTSSIYTDDQIVVWGFPTAGNAGYPNETLVYNWATQKFAWGDEAVEILFRAAVPLRSIDGFDDNATYGGTQSPALYASVDNIPGSLDDAIWSGGSFQLGAILPGGDLGFFTGAPAAAQFESGEVQLTPGRRTFVSEMRALVNAPDAGCPEGIGVQIGERDCQSVPVTWGPILRAQYGGFIPARVDNRYMRFRVLAENGFRDAIGLNVFGEPSGGR